MKRTPIVLGGTVAGLAGVLAFHTTPARSGFPTAPASAGGAAAAGQPAAPAGAGTPTPGAASHASTTVRAAVGRSVNFFYGVLAVKVTVSGKKILKVRIASLDDGGQPRSQFIDSQAIPMLQQQVIQAQSANIHGVSGASYTSAGFVQSLQSALRELGWQ